VLSAHVYSSIIPRASSGITSNSRHLAIDTLDDVAIVHHLSVPSSTADRGHAPLSPDQVGLVLVMAIESDAHLRCL